VGCIADGHILYRSLKCIHHYCIAPITNLIQYSSFYREQSKWDALLRPFELSVWILEAASVIFIGPLIWWFSRYLKSFCLSAFLSLCLSVFLSLCLSLCLCLSVFLSLCNSVSLYLCLSVSLEVLLSLSVSLLLLPFFHFLKIIK
jgi:hypothetical protein